MNPIRARRTRLTGAVAALTCVALSGLGLGLPTPARAWTDKPVRMIVPAPPGGTIDIAARIVADQLSVDIGQPVTVLNRPGAGGAIAVQAMMSSPPDGQTVLMTPSALLTEIPHIMKSGFDPLTDVKAVTTLARAGMVLISNADVPAQDLKSLVAYLKATPGKYSYASHSTGTASHYAGALFNRQMQLDLQHVPFQGSPPALTQLIGGQVTIMFDGIITALPQIKAGKVKAYAVAARTHSTHLPKVPTFAELGYPEFTFSNWVGVVVSAATPQPVITRMNEALIKAAAAPKVRARLSANGFDLIAPMSGNELWNAIRAEYERNGSIVKTFDIQP